MKKNATEKDKSPWRSVAALIAALIAGTSLLVQQKRENHSEGDSKALQQSHQEDRRERLAESPEQRLARLAALGSTASPMDAPDASGPPVPALTPESDLIAAGWNRDPESVLVHFAAWTDRFLAADAATRLTLIEEGIAVATARRAELASQIAQDPRRALSNAVPLAIRSELPLEIQALLENRVDAFGDLGTEYTLAFPGEPDIPDRDFAKIDGTDYTAYRYGNRGKIPFVHNGSIHGIEIDGQLAVLDSALRRYEPGEIPAAHFIDACRIDEIPGAEPVAAAVPSALYQLGGSSSLSACCGDHVSLADAAISLAENNRTQTALAASGNTPWFPSPHEQFMNDSGVAGQTGTLGRPPTSHTHGTKKVLLMRATSTQRPLSSSLSNAYLSSQATDFHARYQRISYGKMGLECTITPVFTMPASIDRPFNDPTFNRDAWHNECKAQAAALGYNLNDYHNFTTILDDTGAGYAGVAAGNLIIQNNNFAAWVYMHEFGHFLSLPHAGAWRSTDGNPMSPSRTVSDYGDWGCYMGNNGSNHFGRTYNPSYLNKLGWLEDSHVQNIRQSGTYTVYQHDGAININDGRIRALKLPRDGEFDYWLSICADNDPGQGGFMTGVAIRTMVGWSGSRTNLVDMNDPSGGAHNAPLTVNQTWYDAGADLTLRTVAVGGTSPNRYATVEITIGPRNNASYRPLVSGGVYRFKNRYNGRYLEIAGDSSANGVPVTVNTASNTNSERWVVWRNADGSYSLNHQGTDKWMDVENNSSANGADIRQWNGNGSDAQKWYVRRNPDGFFYLMHKGTEAVIDMDPSGVNDVKQYQNFQATWQQWEAELVGISDGTYRIIPRHAQAQNLDFNGTGNGTQARLLRWGAHTGQRFNVSNLTGSRLRLSPVSAPGSAVDVDHSGSANGTKIHLWGWNGSAAQRWGLSRVDTNWMRFTPDCATSSCLEVAGTDTAVNDGSVVQLWSFLGQLDQQWRFADSD